MSEKQKISSVEVFGEFTDVFFEHRSDMSDHTVIWSEKTPLSFAIGGHLTDWQVKTIMEMHRDAYRKGKQDQVRKVKRLLLECLEADDDR